MGVFEGREGCNWSLRCQSEIRQRGCKRNEKENEWGGKNRGGRHGNYVVIGCLDVCQKECDESRNREI